MKLPRNFWIRLFPAILWMGFIFFLSTRSTAGIGTTSIDRFIILKTFHLIEYAVLALLFYIAFLKPDWPVIFSYLYAISDEFHQSFTPGRTPKFTDTLIDLFGITLGILILVPVLKRFVHLKSDI